MNVKQIMYDAGRQNAIELQNRSHSMTGTELYAESSDIPSFVDSVRNKNMLDRKAGMTDGFVCRSSAGRVVRLIQNYDSTIFTAEPEELIAQWGFKWSQNPADALPFIAVSTSPYMTGDCCTENGIVYRSKIDSNVWSPSEYPAGWDAEA